VIHLVETADFCRDLGVPFSVTFSPTSVEVLNGAGYDAELMPIAAGS
jgi:hypothetical protein